MIFYNARMVFPEGTREGLELVVTDGKIAEIRERSGAAGIDFRENFLAPGFIDLHIHGALGRDTMDASPESFGAICDYHASGGTTSLLLTTVTASIDDIVTTLRAVRDCVCEIPQIVGVHLEGPFISRVRRGAQREEFIRDPDRDTVERILEFADVIKRVTLAPELPDALDLINQLSARGISISGGHSNAWDEEARAGFDHGMRHVTHTFNCMSSARRRNGVRTAGLLEFALSEPEIRCELIADGYHVSITLMKMLYRAKGPGGICLVTDASAGAGLPNESSFKLGNVDCIVQDGACWVSDHSALAGSAARMIDLVRTMVCEVGVPLHEAVQMATANPARVLKLEEKGTLDVGTDADFVVFSPGFEVLDTYLGGERFFSSIA